MKCFFPHNIFFYVSVVIFLCKGSIIAQNTELGIPFIMNISPHESGYRGANSSLVQDDRGVIYVGNFHGVTEFDGHAWRHIKTNGNPVLAKNSYGEIFVGGFNQLAQLTPDKHGKFTIVPLIEEVKSHFGQVYDIHTSGEKVIFTTKNELLLWHNSLQKLMYDSSFIRIFPFNSKIIINSSSDLILFDFKSVRELPEGSFFSNMPLKGIIPVNEGYYAVSSNAIFKVDFGRVREVTNELSAILKDDNFSCFSMLSNATIAVGTKRDGIIIVDKNLTIINRLSNESGLRDNRVNALMVDAANTLWAAFSDGIARIEYPSPYSYFNQIHGLRGYVHDVVRYNNKLYVATSEGLFCKDTDASYGNIARTFKLIEGNAGECFKFCTSHGQLLASTSRGLLRLSPRPCKVMGGLTQLVQKSMIDKNLIYVSTSNALYTLSNLDGEWITNGGLVGFKTEITSLAESDRNTLWIGTQNEGVYRVDHNDATLMDADVKQFKRTNNLPSQSDWVDAFNTSKGVLFSTSNGLYRYIKQRELFVPDSLVGINAHGGNSRVHPLVEDADKNLWISFEQENNSQKPVAVAWNIPNVNHYTYITQPFNRIRDFNSEVIYPDTNLVVWFGGFNGLACLDFKKLNEDKQIENTLIRRVLLNGDSVLVYNTELNNSSKRKPVKISWRYRNIRFDFATPVFEKNNAVVHQFKLDGFDSQWSPYQSVYSKEYTNLPPGKYIFRVRAKNLFENRSKEASFSFTIRTPYYKTCVAYSIYALMLAFLMYIILKWRALQYHKEKIRLERIIAERTEDVLLEKEKTERLLANILPERTVKELKDKGKATNMRFKMVTVLFSDIQGFTKIAEQMNPDTLVDELDRFFLQFDTIVDKFNIEKIKTIGDAYMCAGGIPTKNRTNPIEVVLAALEMQHFISEQQRKAKEEGLTYWGLRIGIHTGPVVAGVIGSKKFTYDIWGDSVNIASRMESSGEVNRVNISEDTYLLINEYFDCEYRGKMPIKYKGEIDMYFVKGLKANYCDDSLKLVPNLLMRNKLALLRFDDLEEYMLDRLEAELSSHLYYHNVKHTIDVVIHIEIIALEEKVCDEDMLLLKTAALFHDSGFMIGYQDHEMLSIKLANEILPKYGYSHEQVKKVSDLIYATRMPQNPKNKLEEIMCDADLDYLGRPDYLPVSRNLYKELLEMKLIKNSEYEWNKVQLKFLQNHKFFTESAKKRRNQNKNKQLEKILEQDYKFGEENENLGNA